MRVGAGVVVIVRLGKTVGPIRYRTCALGLVLIIGIEDVRAGHCGEIAELGELELEVVGGIDVRILIGARVETV